MEMNVTAFDGGNTTMVNAASVLDGKKNPHYKWPDIQDLILRPYKILHTKAHTEKASCLEAHICAV